MSVQYLTLEADREGTRLFLTLVAFSFLPLFQIIKNKSRQRRHRSGGNARQQILGKNAPAKAAAAKARAASAAVPAATATTPQVSDKIMVSNLPIDVTQEQVHVC